VRKKQVEEIKAFEARAEARGLVARNPAAPGLVHRPGGKRKEFVVIDPDTARKIIDAVAGTDPWDAAVHLALAVRLRREEVLALRWEDVSDDAISVKRALTYAGRQLHIGSPKSGQAIARSRCRRSSLEPYTGTVQPRASGCLLWVDVPNSL
jgi:integrase